MKGSKTRGTALGGAALAVALAGGWIATPAQQSPVSIQLELGQDIYYAGAPLLVRISVHNNGSTAVPNPVKGKLFKSFNVGPVGGTPLKATGKSDTKEPSRPAELAPLSFYGGLVDLTTIFPELKESGTYQINWAAGGLLSTRIQVTIIPRFDPSKEYQAVIETSMGEIHMDFFADQARIATKAFVDMAHAGFYDGLQFHEVRADMLISGGNARFGKPDQRPLRYPAEASTLPIVAGTVVLKPAGASPPANGSEFMILLRPHPELAGQVTVLGQVVKGLDVVQRISRVPSSGLDEQPFFKPENPVEIRRVSIREKGQSATESG